ncbi:MAG: MotA/TolQ/ExbB proton channel family protein [Nitrospirae bacterium]|nr:MotA/TolQ/ExbB proton channel family protein [Nitrospirota bacterium]
MKVVRGMQSSTPLGLLVGVGGMMVAIVLEMGHLNPDFGTPFLKISALLIIFAGGYGAVLLSLPAATALAAPRLFLLSFSRIAIDRQELTNTLTTWAQKARRGGILQLETDLAEVDHPFIHKGLRMIIDGVDPKLVREVLENNIDRMRQRHALGAEVYNQFGGYAPTMGVVGAIVGLIGALSEAGAEGSDPAEVVGAIATAFIASFYGVGIANLILLPIARKLKARSDDEIFMLEAAVDGLLALQQGEHPTYIQDRMNSYFAFTEEAEGAPREVSTESKAA